MNEQQLTAQFNVLHDRIVKLEGELYKQKSINKEIQKRFSVLVDEIKDIKRTLSLE